MRYVDDATLSAARRSNLCCHPSLVAIVSSGEAFILKRLKLRKVTKESGAPPLKHHEAVPCDKLGRKQTPVNADLIRAQRRLSPGYELFGCSFGGYNGAGERFDDRRR